MIDNYDSFTYNLVQYLSELGASVEVARNDAVTPEQAEEMDEETRERLRALGYLE